jgi:hypothetical protein
MRNRVSLLPAAICAVGMLSLWLKAWVLSVGWEPYASASLLPALLCFLLVLDGGDPVMGELNRRLWRLSLVIVATTEPPSGIDFRVFHETAFEAGTFCEKRRGHTKPTMLDMLNRFQPIATAIARQKM